uniref:8.9 kDa family member n=1 Tax=Rhipicephalus zambeziensis TaxID=60191 RepID=A0A224YBH4_9ACAR
MLIKGLCVVSILWWSLAQADWSRVRYTEVRLNTTERHCNYDNHNFTNRMSLNDSCEERWCYPHNHTVLLMTCLDPNSGCTRVRNNKTTFPECCREDCYATSACSLPNGDLLKHGEFYNYTDPCVQYHCENGNLSINARCPEETDPLCTFSFGQGQPFPDCCGIGKLCTAKRDKKRRKRNKGEGRKGKKGKKKHST